MKKSTVLNEIQHLEGNLPNKCVLCTQRDWIGLREGSDLCRPDSDKIFKLTQCLSCGHVMQNPLPDADELSEAYVAGYAPYRPAWKETGWPAWKIFRELTTLRRMRRLKQYAKGSRLLEVGSGSGDFLHAANRAGWNVAAVEYNKQLADTIRSELGLDVRTGELLRGTWPPESFDLIVLWSVLEHVPDPIETLATVSSYLKPGGSVFFQIPTVYGLQLGRNFGKYWAVLDLPRHLNFFGRQSLSKLCYKAGMKLSIFETPLLDIGWCYIASSAKFARGSRTRIQSFMKLALLAPTIALMLPYMVVQSWRGRGTEAFAVAVKQ